MLYCKNAADSHKIWHACCMHIQLFSPRKTLLYHIVSHVQGGPKKVSHKLFSIFLPNIDRF